MLVSPNLVVDDVNCTRNMLLVKGWLVRISLFSWTVQEGKWIEVGFSE